MKGIFVTGTGTGVGKTVAAAATLALLTRYNVNAAPMKPIQTGAVRRNQRWRSPDLDFMLRTAGLCWDDDDYQLAAPYCFRTPCSPHLAALRAQRPISLARIASCAKQLARRYDCLVVEGAGGILVPLTPSKTMLDLVQLLDLPVLIAGHAGLGTLNHTLLTVGALENARIPIAGICLWAPKWGFIERNNMETLRRRTGLLVAAFPTCRSACGARLCENDLEAASHSLHPILNSLRFA